MTTTTTPSDELIRAHAASPRPCAECPWRTANQGKKHPLGNFYSKTNLKRLWTGLRNGERMTCHPTDPRMAEFNMPVPEGAKTVECAGAQVLIQREIVRFQDISAEAERTGAKLTATVAMYRRAHPKGLTKVGLLEHVSTHIFPGLRPTKVNLNEDGIAYEPLVPWEPRSPRPAADQSDGPPSSAS